MFVHTIITLAYNSQYANVWWKTSLLTLISHEVSKIPNHFSCKIVFPQDVEHFMVLVHELYLVILGEYEGWHLQNNRTWNYFSTSKLDVNLPDMKTSTKNRMDIKNGFRIRLYLYVSLRLRVQNGISRLISALCVNCLISIPEYSRIRLCVQNGISCLISALCVNCLISIPEYSRLNHLDVHLV